MREYTAQPVPSTEGEYRRAFEKVKHMNKKLTKELTKAENEIKERCQSYLMEIMRLKQTRPEYKPQPRRQLGFHGKTLTVTVPPAQPLSSRSQCSTQWRQKLQFSTAKTTRVLTSDDESSLTPCKQSVLETVQTSRIQGDARDLEVEMLKEELSLLRQQYQRHYEARISEVQRSSRCSESVGDVSLDDGLGEEETLEGIRGKFEEEIRLAEEKIYVYEAIFVNIYNLLVRDHKDTLRTVEQIRSIKYNELEGKLKTLFGLIRINQDTVMLIEREKKELMEQVEYLSSRVKDFNRTVPVKQDMFVQTEHNFVMKKQTNETEVVQRRRKQSFEITLPQCKTGKIFVKTEQSNDLSAMKQQSIAKIRDLYQEQISEKYKQIATLKSTMKTLITQLQNSVYTTQGVIKKLKVDKQFVQQDSKLEVNDSFTKRQFTRKKILRKSVSHASIKNPTTMHYSQNDKHTSLVVEVLKINRQMAQQNRISEVSAEGRDSNAYLDEELEAASKVYT